MTSASHEPTEGEATPLFEVVLAVRFGPSGIRFRPLDSFSLTSAARKGIEQNLWAEVWIPYHTPTQKVCFTCHIFGKRAGEPALAEMIVLQSQAARMFADFGHLAKPLLPPTGEKEKN